ncbi:hypothetical protein IHE44_0006680, partial [Lamprotornis superbus]
MRCDGDRGVDCSGRGLAAVPPGLSAFTHALDISMNNITRLPEDAFKNFPYLEELFLISEERAYFTPDLKSPNNSVYPTYMTVGDFIFFLQKIQILTAEPLQSCFFSTQNWELVSMPKKSNLKKSLKVVVESVLEVTFHGEVLPRITLKRMKILQANGNA